MFKLFYAPGTCALATHIALEEAGAPYEAVRLDFGSQAQRSPEYLAINPKGRVPALVTESGTLTETPGLLLLRGAAFPAGRTRAAVGSVRPGAGAGVQQLSVLDRACRARAWQARRAMGGRRRGDRGDEAQGAGDHDGMRRADRT